MNSAKTRQAHEPHRCFGILSRDIRDFPHVLGQRFDVVLKVEIECIGFIEFVREVWFEMLVMVRQMTA